MPVPPSSVARPRLDDHARKIVDYAATIVAAGAGFGKTTILHAWAKRCAEDADVVWLGLDEGDARVRALATYLDAALRRALPALGTSVTKLLDEGRSEPAALARALVNELYDATEDCERDVVVFLDDFHTVQTDPGVREFAGELLRVLPPRAHLVFATRFPCEFSPLTKMRAERRIADFDAGHLRFRDDEIVALLADAGLAIPDSVSLRALSRRTDGWAMALRLSTQAPGEIGGGDHPLGESAERSLFAYMAEEVLRVQPPDVRDALLVCSVPNNLDVETVGRAVDGDGARTLESLLARNLYLEPAGERRYRFHNLFREFLLQTFEREDPQRARETRLRYANLLETRGDTVSAVSQYIQAGDYNAAFEYVVPAMRAIKWSDDFERIARVLEEIPDDVMRARPDVLRMRAMAKRRSLDFRGAIAELERVIEYAAEIGDTPTECIALNDLALLYDDMRLGGYGRYERNIALAKRALEKLREDDARSRSTRLSALVIVAIGYASMYDFELAHEYLDRVVEMSLANPRMTDSLNLASYYYGLEGKWPRSLEMAELSESLVREAGPIFLGRALHLQAKALCYLRKDLPRALALAEEGLELERTHNQFDNLPETYITLARAQLAQELPNVRSAHAALDEAERRLRRWQNRIVQFELHVARVQAHLIDGDHAAAERQLTLANTIAERYGDPRQRATAALIDGMLRAARGDEAGALARYEAACTLFEPTHDLFQGALAELAACGLEARAGTLRPERLRALLDRIERDNQHCVVLNAPRSALEVLEWSLRHDIESERARPLLEPGAHVAGAVEIEALATDPRASSAARVAAVGILARGGDRRRDLLVRLSRDPSPAVAAAATVALGLMPAGTAAPLSLRVVGRASVELGSERIDERDARWGRRKAIELLRALALAEGPVPKTTITSWLWPDASPSAAETSLRVTLHALRRALQPDVDGPGDYVEYDGLALGLKPHTLAFVDAREALGSYRRAAFARSKGATAEARAAFLQTVELLPSLPDEDAVPAWLQTHVRTWRETLAHALRALAEIERESGALATARGYVERALAIDPLDESSVAEAIEISLAGSDLERARRVFVEYKERLAAELDARPGPELLERYGRVVEARAAVRSVELSERDRLVLTLVSRGRSSKQIAFELGVSAFSINAQIARIMRKLNVDSRAAAVAAASGLLDL